MPCDALILNTLVMDLRSRDFAFADALVGPGGLAICPTTDMPDYSQDRMQRWIEAGAATAGGPGNVAPLAVRAGLNMAVGGSVGKGGFGGLDAQGRAFCDALAANGVDLVHVLTHPTLPTGTAFIYDAPDEERGGIAYFPNANNDIDFGDFQKAVEDLEPTVVYYMYSGLSEAGDANGGRDLADFMAWSRARGCITIADCHTMSADPGRLIAAGKPVDAYRLLEPVLPHLDVFFTSTDEARMIENTIATPRDWTQVGAEEGNAGFLELLAERFWPADGSTRLCGVTLPRGAVVISRTPSGAVSAPTVAVSPFMAGQVIDLVGAGDSFRAGLISYVARHAEEFRAGTIDIINAVQMGNLFASLFIKAPLGDRYGNIRPFERMLEVVRGGATFDTFESLMNALNA